MARARRSDDVDAPAPARSDAYVGLLLISLLAQIAGATFFYLDWNSYEGKKPRMPGAITTPGTSSGGQGGAKGDKGGDAKGGQQGGPKGEKGDNKG